MDSDELLGVFPSGNPIPYTGLEEILHTSNVPRLCTWYHGTWSNRLASIARYGLLPSCWFGGDCCCVFGFDNRRLKTYAKYGDWVVQVKSRVDEDTDLKAWWVPPSRVEGAWHKGHFYRREDLLYLPGIDVAAQLRQPSCPVELCHTQYLIWQHTVTRLCTFPARQFSLACF